MIFMLKIALIGTWHVHFNGYAKQFAAREDCKITCLWDPDEALGKAAAEKYGCEFVADYDALLARDDVDAIAVCTSTDMHRDVMIKAAKAGKHIFTEKVLCFDIAEAEEIKAAVKESGVKFCISFPWRGRADFQWIKKAVDDGLLGQITYMRMRNAHNGVSSHWLPDTFFDKKTCGGGAMMDLGAHSMYLLNWFLGKPVKGASAFTNVFVKSVEDNAVTVMTYENGAIGVSETGFVAENNPFELEISGLKGTLLGGGNEDKIRYNLGEGWVYPEPGEGLKNPIDMFVDGILYGGEICYTIDDAYDLTATMRLAYDNIM